MATHSKFVARVHPAGWVVALMASALFGLSPVPTRAQSKLPADPARAVEVLARVGSQEITLQEYAMALRTEARRRFYHAKPPEDVLTAFRREVADQLIDRTLAMQEAQRRDIRLDKTAIDTEMDKYRARRGQAGSEHNNKAFWDALRREMEQEQLVAKLRAQVHGKVKATPTQIKQYYEQHPDKFTQPDQMRVSVILLKVAPSSPQPVWEAATREATQIRTRFKAGSEFAELARVHSSDASAANGGDMGYLHKGMLAPEVETTLSTLAEGDVTEPLTVLEGVALFRLVGRKPARLGTFEEVKTRATELWTAAQQTHAWKALMTQLRASTAIKLDERYLRSPAATRDVPEKSGATTPLGARPNAHEGTGHARWKPSGRLPATLLSAWIDAASPIGGTTLEPLLRGLAAS